MTTTTHGYSMLLIIVHWLTVLALVALFITHEGKRGSAMMNFHLSGGALLGLFIIRSCLWRPIRGFAHKPNQRPSLNLISSIVMWGLLIGAFGTPMQSDRATLRILPTRISHGFDVQ